MTTSHSDRGRCGVRRLMVVGLLAAVSFLGGCVSHQAAETTPGVNLSGLKTFYVRKLPADERGIERLISERLNAMGRRSTYGTAATPKQPVDAIVTYQDRWMWDITMYMISLAIQIRDPANDVVLANGTSTRSSLTRKSPEEMVKEVLDRIFGTTQTPAK